jgi:hypothetical protein
MSYLGHLISYYRGLAEPTAGEFLISSVITDNAGGSVAIRYPEMRSGVG